MWVKIEIKVIKKLTTAKQTRAENGDHKILKLKLL